MRKKQMAEEIENLRKENEALRVVARRMYSDYVSKLMTSELKGEIPTKMLYGNDYAKGIVEDEIEKLVQLNEYFNFDEDYIKLVKSQLAGTFMIEES